MTAYDPIIEPPDDPDKTPTPSPEEMPTAPTPVPTPALSAASSPVPQQGVADDDRDGVLAAREEPQTRKTARPGALSPRGHDTLTRWAVLAGMFAVLALTGVAFYFSPDNAELSREGAEGFVMNLNRFGVRATGLLAGLFFFLQLLAMARIPLVERVLDRGSILRSHAIIGALLVILVLAHVGIRTWGLIAVQAKRAHKTAWEMLLDTYGHWTYVLAILALLSLLAVVATSAARRGLRLRRVFWHRIHLLAYVAILAAVPHELAEGTTLDMGTPLTLAVKVFWIVLLLATFSTVVYFRIIKPIRLNRQYQLRVVKREWINDDGDLAHVLIAPHPDASKQLTDLKVEAGQYGQWYWGGQWRSWPTASCFTISDIVPITANYTEPGTGKQVRGLVLRLTMQVKIPSHTGRPGQKVYLGGVYGNFTAKAIENSALRKVLILVNGTGATPMLPLVKELVRQMMDDPTLEVVVVQRVSSEKQLLFREQLNDLVKQAQQIADARGDKRKLLEVHEIIGPRAKVSRWGTQRKRFGRSSWLTIDELTEGEEAALLRYGAPIRQREVYLCGSRVWSKKVRKTLRVLKVHPRHIHEERF